MRAESQVRRWNKESKDGVFQSVITKKIPEGEGARRKILQYERDRAIELRNKGMLRDEKYHKIP